MLDQGDDLRGRIIHTKSLEADTRWLAWRGWLVIVSDDLKEIPAVNRFSAIEASGQLMIVCLVVDVVQQALSASRVPTSCDGLLYHGLFTADGTFINSLVSDLS